jgi:dihydropyrimidine dehydrogenase (NADP+)
MATLSMTQIRTSNSTTGFSLNCSKKVYARPSRVGFKVFASETQSSSEPDLSVTVNFLHMPNPFIIGSGPPGTNYTVMKRAFDEGWGAVIAKTVSFLIHINYLLYNLLD